MCLCVGWVCVCRQDCAMVYEWRPRSMFLREGSLLPLWRARSPFCCCIAYCMPAGLWAWEWYAITLQECWDGRCAPLHPADSYRFQGLNSGHKFYEARTFYSLSHLAGHSFCFHFNKQVSTTRNITNHSESVLPEVPFAASLASFLISMYFFFLSIGTYCVKQIHHLKCLRFMVTSFLF